MRKGYVIIALLFLALSVASCSSEHKGGDDETREGRGEERMSSGEIVDRYVDTLTTARGKALDSAEAVEESTRAIERAIEEADATGGDQ
jgi:hypothetical protein